MFAILIIQSCSYYGYSCVYIYMYFCPLSTCVTLMFTFCLGGGWGDFTVAVIGSMVHICWGVAGGQVERGGVLKGVGRTGSEYNYG